MAKKSTTTPSISSDELPPATTRSRPTGETTAPAPVRPQATSAEQQKRSLAFAVEAARLLQDEKCQDIVLLDVRGKSQVTDFILIGSGTSERQMRAALMHVEELGRDQKQSAYRTSADERGTWLLADCVHVVVHVFEPAARAHYDLEMMWGDAPRIPWQREVEPPDAPAKPKRRTTIRRESSSTDE